MLFILHISLLLFCFGLPFSFRLVFFLSSFLLVHCHFNGIFTKLWGELFLLFAKRMFKLWPYTIFFLLLRQFDFFGTGTTGIMVRMNVPTIVKLPSGWRGHSINSTNSQKGCAYFLFITSFNIFIVAFTKLWVLRYISAFFSTSMSPRVFIYMFVCVSIFFCIVTLNELHTRATHSHWQKLWSKCI